MTVRRQRRFLALLVSGVLAASPAACTSDSTVDESSPDAPEPTTEADQQNDEAGPLAEVDAELEAEIEADRQEAEARRHAELDAELEAKVEADRQRLIDRQQGNQ